MSSDEKPIADAVREIRAVGEKSTAEILGERRDLSAAMSDDEARKQMSRHTRRSFLVGGVAALTAVLGWRWMGDERKAALLRGALEFNERLSQIFYSPARLAPEFSPQKVSEARVNGMFGLTPDFDPSNWKLAIGGLAGRDADLFLTLEDIKSLPRTEMTTELKCIEGWSIIVHWAGVRFSDFAAKYQPRTSDGSPPDINNRPGDLLPYVSLSTPDNEYFVGWDMPSIMHPQTLLAYEMNGAPLTLDHGAPLRLASPTKYGIKLIKRIGRIEFTDVRPKDYWAQYGYDWYSGH